MTDEPASPTWRLAVVTVAYLTVTATIVPFVAVPAGGSVAAAGNDCTALSSVGDVSEGVTIFDSGCYVVTQDYTGESGAPSVLIAADDVRLVGAGGGLTAGPVTGGGPTPTDDPGLTPTPTDSPGLTPTPTPTDDGVPDGQLSGGRVGVFVDGATNVTVQNLSVTDYDVGVYARSGGGVTVQSVAVGGANQTGVTLDGVAGAAVVNSSIENAPTAVRARNTLDLLIAGNEIVGEAAPGAAVAVGGTAELTNVTILANRLHDTGPVGIRVSGAEQAGLLDNVVDGVASVPNGAPPAGVVVGPGAPGTFLRNNTVRDVAGDGLRLSGVGVTVASGVVSQTDGDGVRVAPSVQTSTVTERLANLTVTDTDGHGVALAGATGAVLSNVTVRGTDTTALSATDGTDLTVENTTLDPTPGSTPPERLVYVDGDDGNLTTLSPVSRTVTDYGVAATVIGPAAAFDDDGVVEVPFVGTDGSLSVAEPDGETTEYVADGIGDAAPLESKSKLAVGDWDDDDDRLDVLYAAGDGGLYRVDGDEIGSPTEIPTTKQVQFVAGVVDVTDDGHPDAVYVTSSSGLRYVDGRTGEDVSLPVASTWGANDQIGLGEPSVVDGRLVAARVGGSGEPQRQLFDTTGSVAQIADAQLPKTAPTLFDIDGDGEPAFAFVDADGLVTTRGSGPLTTVTGANASVTPDAAVGLASRTSAPVAAVETADGDFVGRNLTVDGVARVGVTGQNVSVRGRSTLPAARNDSTALAGGVRVRATGPNATATVGFGYTDDRLAATGRAESTVGVGRYADGGPWVFPGSEQSPGDNRVTLPATTSATNATGLYAPFVGATGGDETGPTVSVTIDDEPGAAATLRVIADEPLATLSVTVDGPGPVTVRERETFTETALDGGSYAYELPLGVPAGAVDATVESATDAAGNAAGETPTENLNVTARAIVDDDSDADFQTIAAAAKAIQPDSVIAVANGTYSPGNLTVPANTTLSLSSGTVLDGTGVNATASLRVGDGNLSVRGGTIRSYDIAVAADDGAAGNVSLRGTRIEDLDGSAVTAQETTGDWTLRNVTVQNTSGDGVAAFGAEGDWVVRNTTVRGAGGVGLSADATAGDWLVRTLTVRNVSDDGVSAYLAVGDWTVERLTVAQTGAFGVDASETSGAWTLQNVTVQNTTNDGVVGTFSVGEWSVADLVVASVDGAGVDANEATGDWGVVDSRVKDTGGSAIRATNVTGGWALNASVLAGYGGVGVNATSATQTVDATNVYWDDGDAPTTTSNGSSVGDCVGNVDCASHLTSRPGSNETDTGGNETDPGGNETDPSGNETVDPEPPFTVDTDGGADFQTIQPALDAASDGEEVVVRAGTYEIDTPLTVETNLTLSLAPDAVVEPTVFGGVGLVIENGSAPTVAGGAFDGFETAVDAHGTTGNWTVESVTVFVGELGVAVNATNATGDWTVETATVEGFGRNGVVARGTTGDWVVRNSSFRERRTAVVAREAGGDWLVQNVTTTETDTAVAATNATGDWAVRAARLNGSVDASGTSGDWLVVDTTLTDGTAGGALDASGGTGDWTVRGAVVTNTDGVALLASSPTGNWTVTGSRLSGATTGIVAGGGADWAVHNTTVASNGNHGVLAAATDGDWTVTNATVATPNGTGVAAGGTTGDWTVVNATVAAETAVAAEATVGDWTVTRSVLQNYTVGVDASDAVQTGDAREVYWDDGDAPTTAPNGSSVGDCVGNVDCANYLTSPSGRNETDPGDGTGGNETDPGDGTGGNETDPGDGTGGNETDPGGNETDPGGNETVDVEPPFTVDADGSAEFQTIQPALDAADDDEEVVVRAGTYEVDTALVIERSLTLSLAPDAVVVPAGPGETGLVIGNGSTPTVVGGTFEGFETAVDARTAGGDWTLRNLTVQAAGGVGVDARGTAGDWLLAGVTVAEAAESGVVAADTEGDWAIRNTTVSNVGSAVDAANATGDWTLRNVTVSESGQDAVFTANTTGDWLVDGLDARTVDAGVDTSDSAGDWRIQNTSVRNATGVGVDAYSATGDWTISGLHAVELDDDGILAETATGDWLVRDSVFTAVDDDAVDADETGGDWTLRNLTVAAVSSDAVSAGETAGDWVARELTVEDADRAVYAGDTEGDWLVRDSAFGRVADDAVAAYDATGNWTVRNTTVRNVTGAGVAAYDATGDWTLQNATVRGAVVAVGATNATGDWRVVGSLLRADATAVVAANTTGDWRVETTSVAPRVVDGGGAFGAVGASTAVDARRSDGDWVVTDSRLAVLAGQGDPAAGTAVYAADTTGAWTVTNGTVTTAGTGPVVNATGAEAVGDASRNWLGGAGDCAGAVDCGDRRESSPFVDVQVTTNDSVVRPAPIDATVTVTNERRVFGRFRVAVGRENANETATPLTLPPGESETLSVDVSTAGALPSTTVVTTVADEGPAQSAGSDTSEPAPVAVDRNTTAVETAFGLAVENVTVARLRPGEPAAVVVGLRNVGVRGGSGEVTLGLDGDGDGVPETSVGSDAVELAASGETLVTFELSGDRVQPGRLTLVAATAHDNATVTGTVPTPPAIRLAGATVPPAAGPSQRVTVPVQLANDGELPANATVGLQVGEGTVVDTSQTVTVPPGGRSLELGFDTDGIAGGNYTVQVSVNGPLADNATGTATDRLAVQPEAPDLTVTPANRSLGDVPLGATRTATVTVGNDGGATANVTGLRVVGSAFRLAESATGPVAPGETRTVTLAVTAPTTPGSFQGRLRVESTDPDEPVQTAGLSGTATGPVAATNTERLRLFSQPVGGTANATLLVSNEGTEPLAVSAVRLAGSDAFRLRTGQGGLSGGSTIPPGEASEVRVAFTPATGGPASATATVVTNDTTLTVDVTGAGEQPTAAVDRDRLAFGAVGTESVRTRTVQLRNDGGAALTVQNVTLSGSSAFRLTSGGGSGVLVPGATRTLTVEFRPSAAGRQTATLQVDADGPAQPTVTLTGVGNVSNATLGTASVDFDDTGVGSSGLREVALSNTGNETLVVRNATVVGTDATAFRAVTADGIAVGPGESANVSFAFSPETVGSATATLRLATNDPDDPVVTVAVAGRGARADVSASPSSLGFGPVRAGETANRTVTVENVGSVATSLASARFTDGSAASFSAGDLSGRLASGESTTLNVTFAPTAGGEATGVLAVRNDTGAVVTRVSVGGVGAVPDAAVNTTQVSFPTTRVAGTTTRTVLVANDGTAPLNVSRVRAVDGPFRVVDRPETIGAGGVGRVTVAFQPTAVGSEVGKLRFQTDDPDGLSTVRLAGDVVTVRANADGNVTFGEVATDESKTESVTVSNAPDATAAETDRLANLTVTGAEIVGPDASAYSVSDVNFTLAPGESTTVDVTLTPASGGRKFARLRLFTTDPSQPQLDTFLSNTRTVIEVDTVVANETSGPGAEVSVQNAPSNTTLPANVSSPATRRGDVGVENLNVSVGDANGNFSVEFTQADLPPASNAPNFSAPEDRNVDPVKYVRVNKTLSDDEIRNATFRLRVSKVQIAESGTAPEEISLYRFVDDGWVELDGSLVGETTTHYVYSVVTPGFSDFAAGAKKPEFEITNAEIPPGDVDAVAIRVGDQVDILVRITNEEGAADGTFTTELLLDGDVVERRDVTVAAGGTRQTRFVRSFEGAGEFGVRVNNESAGTVEVSARDSGDGGGDSSDAAAPLEVTERSLNHDRVTVGEPVTFAVTVRNPDSTAKTFDADLRVAGVDLVDRLVSVPGGETARVDYTRSFDRPGSYDVSIGDSFVGTVTVVAESDQSPSATATATATPPTGTQTPTATPPVTDTRTPTETADGPASTETPATPATPTTSATQTPAGEGDLTVVNAFLESEEVTQGTLLTVTAVVENTGTARAERSVPLVVNGLTVARTPVALAPGESTRVTFDRRFQSAGEFTVAVGDTTAGELTVVDGAVTETTAGTPARTATTATSTDTSFPGFGPAVGLVALLAAAALLARRRR